MFPHVCISMLPGVADSGPDAVFHISPIGKIAELGNLRIDFFYHKIRAGLEEWNCGEQTTVSGKGGIDSQLLKMP